MEGRGRKEGGRGNKERREGRGRRRGGGGGEEVGRRGEDERISSPQQIPLLINSTQNIHTSIIIMV